MSKEKKGFFKEFKEFISRGNVLDMAVGIIVGGAFTAIITAIVSGILTPVLQSIGVGDDGFGALQIVLREATETSEAVIMDFGVVISAIITFLLTAFILFLIVWSINRIRARADALKAKRQAEAEAAAAEPAAEPAPEEPAPAPAPTVEELLAQIRDLLAAQNEKKE